MVSIKAGFFNLIPMECRHQMGPTSQVSQNVIDSIKGLSPWWFKIGVKLVLSRLSLSYSDWRRLGIAFQHGQMLNPDYSLGVFRRHFARAQAYLPSGYNLMELGPGDSLATAVIASIQEARKIWLVDIGMFASMDIASYQPLFQRLEEDGHSVRYLSVADMLRKTHSSYLIQGLSSLRTLRDDALDWIFSQAVLEHVPLVDFEETISELYRIQKPLGISSHRIDLQDHLAHNINSLRFSNTVWESSLFRHSGFYTNRLRASQIVDTFQKAGYRIVSLECERWPALPLKRSRLHADYAGFPEDDLLVRAIDLVVQKP